MPAKRIKKRSVAVCLSLGPALFLTACGSDPPSPLPDDLSWERIEERARGSEVALAMWDGDPLINAYMRTFVVPRLEEDHGVALRIVSGQGNAIVSKLMVEREAKRASGDLDLVWINGETFYQLRQLEGLYGPFTDRLPNNAFVDWEDPFVSTDFQQAVDGYESPWGSVQLAIIYDAQRVPEPPRDKEALAAWVKAHPGRFTFDVSFTGLTFLKSLLYDFAGGPESLDGPFDEAHYRAASDKLFAYFKEIQPYLWRSGETFPENVAQLHQLMANGEVDFSMSNNDGEVDNKVSQGILPPNARAYVLDTGTIRNAHYMGIPFNAANKAGALVVANFLISPAAQYEKAKPKVWGDGSVLASEKLPPKWRDKFANIPGRKRVASRAELRTRALAEPPPEVMVRLNNDFRRKIIEGRP